MGKPAATDRPRLPSLSHSFTLDLQTEWLGPIVNNNVQYHKEMLSSPAAIPGAPIP